MCWSDEFWSSEIQSVVLGAGFLAPLSLWTCFSGIFKKQDGLDLDRLASCYFFIAQEMKKPGVKVTRAGKKGVKPDKGKAVANGSSAIELNSAKPADRYGKTVPDTNSRFRSMF